MPIERVTHQSVVHALSHLPWARELSTVGWWLVADTVLVALHRVLGQRESPAACIELLGRALGEELSQPVPLGTLTRWAICLLAVCREWPDAPMLRLPQLPCPWRARELRLITVAVDPGLNPDEIDMRGMVFVYQMGTSRAGSVLGQVTLPMAVWTGGEREHMTAAELVEQMHEHRPTRGLAASFTAMARRIEVDRTVWPLLAEWSTTEFRDGLVELTVHRPVRGVIGSVITYTPAVVGERSWLAHRHRVTLTTEVGTYGGQRMLTVPAYATKVEVLTAAARLGVVVDVADPVTWNLLCQWFPDDGVLQTDDV